MKRNNNTGSITYDKSVKRISARIKIDGKIIKKTFMPDRMQEAEDWLKEMKNTGKVKDYTVENWLKVYIKNYREKFLRKRSLERLNQSAEKWKDIYPILLKDLKPIHIQKVINKMMAEDLSSSTIKKAREILNSALEQAVSERLITYNSASSVKIPKNTVKKKKIEILSCREIGRVFYALEKIKRNKMNNSQRHNTILFFRLLLYTGIRVSELLALRWEDVKEKERLLYIHGSKNLDNQDINLPKTEAGIRYVPIFSSKTEKGFVFSNKNGGAVSYQRFFLHWQKACNMAGFHKGIHSLRHTCISYLLTYMEIPLAEVSAIAGHANPAITLSIYTHVIKEYRLKLRTKSGQTKTSNTPKKPFSWQRYILANKK